MIDLAQLRREPDEVKAALARRGIGSAQMDELLAVDAQHRTLLHHAEQLRAQVKALSRQVAEARRAGDESRANELTTASRDQGDLERAASEAADLVGAQVRVQLMDLPNVPAPDAPDGTSEDDNVELRRWWPGMDEGLAMPSYAEHQ